MQKRGKLRFGLDVETGRAEKERYRKVCDDILNQDIRWEESASTQS